jgi:uncharacterized membrane protein YoaK (UPF0700 family)
MPMRYTRKLTGKDRSTQGNRHLGTVLAFVAGAINAGGFLAVKQYTSHMTGILSSVADNLVLGAFDLVLSGVGALISFLAGAACTAIVVNYARRRNMHAQYALPLLLEAILLLGFGLMGVQLTRIEGLFVPMTVMLLCFMMGLQNALITKISNAEIRTTHVTGMLTDIGIELGKSLYRNDSNFHHHPPVKVNLDRLKLLTTFVFAFFVGGLTGAFGFKHVGYVASIPLAIILILLAIAPALDDLTVLREKNKNP